jgi:ABC transport system ATP-binding/permease protein
MSKNICQHCGTPNVAQARFCAKCGKPLQIDAQESTILCPKCGAKLRKTARFCPSCGHQIESQPVQKPISSQPPQPKQSPRQSPSPATQMMGASGDISQIMVRWMGGITEDHILSKPVETVGRAPSNDIVINHPAVSSRHLSLQTSKDGFTVTDLNSTNGTQLNGKRIPANQAQPIQKGDVIRIGDLTGNWVSITIGGEDAVATRALSLGKLDLSDTDKAIIGRDPNSYLPLNHPTVSFRHAMIFKQGDSLYIRDLGSTNGTFVDGSRISQVPLKSGDEIQIGPFKLTYDAQQQSLAQSMRLGHRLDAILLGREVANRKMILDNISLSVYPGEFVAFVGGSGAGKSTLMKAMNGYEPANHGQMLLDGELFYPKMDQYRNQMGYVPQDDIIHRVLPVHIALWYAAKLRLPDARPAEITSRIREALISVDMEEHAQKPVRVLSGGQRKRVSIAVELLAHPTLFFLDEPTSGLDPGLEKKMMYDLNRLADEGRTVVLVTHATANIEQCDHVAFLSYGRLAYYGPPDEALKFYDVRDFSDIYLKLSQEINPAHGKQVPKELTPYYQQRKSSGDMVAGILWADHYQQSPEFKKYVGERQKNLRSIGRSAGIVAPPPNRTRDSFLRQMVILARRQFDLIRYDWRTLFILLLMMPLIGFLFMTVSYEDDLVGRPGTIEQIEADLKEELEGKEIGDSIDYIPTTTAETLLVMISLALTQGGTFTAAYEIVKEKAIFRRERAVNLSVVAYVLSKILILGGFALLQVVSVILILAIKLDMGFEGVFLDIGIVEMIITFYLAVLASITFGLFISAIVPTPDVVLYAILIQLFVQIILSGTLFPLESNPVSLGVVGYWAMDSIGSIVDLPKLNEEGRICTIVEIPSMTGGEATKEVRCDSAERDLALDYEHTKDHVFGTWIGLLMHAFVWAILTIIVQARKKGE